MTSPSALSPDAPAELVEAAQRLHAATLVAAIVGSAKRPHSLAEVVRLDRQVFNAVYRGGDAEPGPALDPADRTAAAPAETPHPIDALLALRQLAEERGEPHFGRREEPPAAVGADADIDPVPPLESRRGDPPAVPPPMASAHEAVRRVRAAAIGDGGSDHPPIDAPTPAKARRRRGQASAALGLIAVLGAGAGGTWTLARAPGAATAVHGRDSIQAAIVASRPAPRTAIAASAPIRAAMVLSPPPARPAVATAPAATRPAAASFAQTYAAAVALIEKGDRHGVAQLRRLADQDYAPAQFHLASLYARGADGLGKDPGRARRWTRRAAEAGESKAMHNLALYDIDGAGGPKDPVAAAEWFRKAADLGLTDSQFNLGRLYEEGLGVPRNAAEALKWYSIAARSGDAEALSAATRLRARVSPPAGLAAARSAGDFHPLGAAPAAASFVVAAADDIATVKRTLSQLGYYQGPPEGGATPALRMALAAYQRDHGLPATGAPDSATVTHLAALSR